MKFNELPKEMQITFLKGCKEAEIAGCIIWIVFFTIVTIVLLVVKHGWEYFSALSILFGSVGVVKLPIAIIKPFDCEENIRHFDPYTFSIPSESESN